MTFVRTDNHLLRSRNRIVSSARCSRSASKVVIAEGIVNRSRQFAGKVRTVIIAGSFQVFLLAIVLVLEVMRPTTGATMHIRFLITECREVNTCCRNALVQIRSSQSKHTTLASAHHSYLTITLWQGKQEIHRLHASQVYATEKIRITIFDAVQYIVGQDTFR